MLTMWLAGLLFINAFLSIFLAVSGNTIQYQVTEETGANFFIGSILQDATFASRVNDTKNLEFSLLSSGNGAASNFFVDAKNGSIFTNKSLDRDTICQYEDICVLSVGVVAKSPGNEFFEIIKIEVEILDINDHGPVFQHSTAQLQISENVAINTTFSLDGAVDLDSEEFSVRRYEIANADVPFRAEADSYPDGRSMLRLIVTEPLDRERQSFFQIQISAIDGGDPPFSGYLFLEIEITDVNDNYPTFSKPSYNVTVDDSSEFDTLVTKVTAYDEDSGENGQVEYRFAKLQSSDIFEHFAINSSHGVISVKKSFHASQKESFTIKVEATDQGKQPLVSQCFVYVKIRDTYNDYPVINVNILSDGTVAEVSEHASYGSVIAHVAVSDPDTGANGLVTCTISAGNFGIQRFEDDENEYKITVAASLNREVMDSYDVTIKCSDAGSPPRISNATFEVKVLDENDHTPTFYQKIYEVSVKENNRKGIHVLDVLAVDYDISLNSAITYSVASIMEDRITINKDNGSIYVNMALDKETLDKFSFYVFASDDGTPPLTGTATVTVLVEDENDNAPKFSYPNFTFSVKENMPPQTYVGTLSADDADSDRNGEIFYRLPFGSEKGPVKVSENGSIYTDQSFDREVQQMYRFFVEASDKGVPTRTTRAEILLEILDENDNVPVFVFPNGSNNTVILTYGGSKSTKVATLQALDADVGTNARLAYFSNDRNYSDIFAINSGNGELVLIRNLGATDMGSYKLDVLVKDSGQPPLYNQGILMVVVKSPTEPEVQKYSKYYVIAITMAIVTVTIALLILLIIFFIRRRERQALNESNARQQFIDKIKEGEEAGFSPENSLSISKDVYYPPGYEFGTNTRQFHTLERAKSYQVPSTIAEQDTGFQDRVLLHLQAPIWENQEADEDERHRNQILSLQYQQNLMKIKSVKRSHSVLTL